MDRPTLKAVKMLFDAHREGDQFRIQEAMKQLSFLQSLSGLITYRQQETRPN